MIEASQNIKHPNQTFRDENYNTWNEEHNEGVRVGTDTTVRQRTLNKTPHEMIFKNFGIFLVCDKM